MSRRTLLLSTASVAALFAAMPVYLPSDWYGAVDAGWHYGLDNWSGVL